MSPIMLLTGNSELLKIDFLKDVIKNSGISDISVLYADEINIREIIEQCSQGSLFSSSRLVVIKSIDSFKEGQKRELEEEISNYLKNPNPDCLLILLAENFSKEFLLRAREVGEVIEFKRMYRRGLISYIEKKLKEHSIFYKEEVLDYILYITNEDEWEVENCLQLILSYSDKEKRIEIEELKKLLSRSNNYSVFDLVDGLFEKKIEKALHSLQDLKLMGESINKALYVLLKNARLLWAYLSLKDKSVAEAQLKIRSFELNRLRIYSRFSDMKYLSRIMELLRRVEVISKQMPPDFAYLEIEKFLFTL